MHGLAAAVEPRSAARYSVLLTWAECSRIVIVLIVSVSDASGAGEQCSSTTIGERLGMRALAGAGLVVVGLFLAEWKGPAQAAAESPGPVTEAP